MTNSVFSSSQSLHYYGPTGGGVVPMAARAPNPDEAVEEEADPSSCSFLVPPPPPEISRRPFIGYDDVPTTSLPLAAAFGGARKNKHRSCGCPVNTDGMLATSQYRCCVLHSYSSCPAHIATAAAAAATPADPTRSAEERRSFSDSLSASFDDLEQRIKRVRLSSTPGELCWAREARDLCTRHGWRVPPPAHPQHTGAAATHAAAAAAAATTTTADWRVRPAPASSSNNPYGVGTTAASSSSSGEQQPSWYEKVLHEIVADEDGSIGDVATADHRASCRMLLEPLAPHRLALHLQYRALLREDAFAFHDENDKDDDMGYCCRRDLRHYDLPDVRVDIRIPRHYPHEPPVVSSVRYSSYSRHDHSSAGIDDDGDDDAAMEMHYPRRAASDSWLHRKKYLCKVDSIVIVPFDLNGGPSDPERHCDQEISESSRGDNSRHMALEPVKQGDVNDVPMTTTATATTAAFQEPPPTTKWNPEYRREMKLHGYSPVHLLSDVLERIAAALYAASPRNTTHVVPTAGGGSDDGSTGSRRSGGAARDVRGTYHRHAAGCSGAAREGSVMSAFPTHASSAAAAASASSSSDASWLSAFVAAGVASAGVEADRATERHL